MRSERRVVSVRGQGDATVDTNPCHLLRLQTSFGVKANDFQVIRPDRPTKTYTCKLADQVLYPPMVHPAMQQTDRQMGRQLYECCFTDALCCCFPSHQTFPGRVCSSLGHWTCLKKGYCHGNYRRNQTAKTTWMNPTGLRSGYAHRHISPVIGCTKKLRNIIYLL